MVANPVLVDSSVNRMKKPLQQDEVFLADVAAARRESRSLHVWWLGQSGFLVQWKAATCSWIPTCPTR